MSDTHEYPPDYPPGKHWSIDAAWEILDSIKPGLIPQDIRCFLAGQIAGRLVQEQQLSAIKVTTVSPENASAEAMHAALSAADLSYSARSWNGFNLFGDTKSISEVDRLEHEAHYQRERAKYHSDRADKLLAALEASVQYQSHYGQLLNIYDGGERMAFASAADWLARLAALEKQK